MLTPEKLKELKDTQKDRIDTVRSFWVDSWQAEIEIRKLKPNDMILAEKACVQIDDNGQKIHNDEIRKAVLVLIAVEGLHPLRDKEFIMDEPAGVIHDIFKEVLEFSGYGNSVEMVVEDKKKV